MTSLRDIKGKFTIDPSHSLLGFAARHAMVTKVHGSFAEFEGTAEGDGADPSTAKVDVKINATSITTNNEMRDKHLRSGDFFDAENYPEITFSSTKVEVVDDETLEITGNLNIKGNSKEITIPFEFGGAATDAYGNLRIGFEGKKAISRKEFGLTWNAALEAGGVMVSDKIMLEIEISAVEVKEEA